MRVLRWALALVWLAGGCTADLENAPCPCLDKTVWDCCTATQTCYRIEGGYCPSGPVGEAGSAGASQGGSEFGGSSGAASGGAFSGGSESGGVTTGGATTGGVATGGADSGGAPPDESGGTSPNISGGAPSALGGAAGGSARGGSGGVSGSATMGGAAAGGSLSAGAAGVAGGGGGTREPTFASVPTQHNDNGRTGANLNETALDASNVKPSSFGELSRRPLRGAVFSQPLVVTDVAVDGRKADVLYVATMANEVYALDARAPERAPLWVRSLGPSIVLRDVSTDPLHSGSGRAWHEIGIYSTPVAVPSEGALYVVAATSDGVTYAHHVHKLSLSTGEVVKSIQVQRAGFDSSVNAQASALTFAGGALYVAFGGYDAIDGTPGFVFAYDANLGLIGSAALGNPDGGGVSMSGQGPAASPEGDSIFFTTNPSITINVASRLLEMRYGAPSQVIERLFPYASSNSLSNELGTTGPLLVPNSDRMLLAGQHRFYVVNRRATNPADSLVQEFRASASSVCEQVSFACSTRPNPPVFWKGSGEVPSRVFVWSPHDLLRSFQFNDATGRVDCPGPESVCPALRASIPADSDDRQNHVLQESPQLSISADGTRAGSGIVWATHPFLPDGSRAPDGIVRAYDADTLRSIWSTEKTELPFGPIAPSTTATVSGGRLYVASADGHSNKTIFEDDYTGGPPALTNFGDQYLVIAWGMPPSNPTRGFQLAWSSDGVHFENGGMLPDNFLSYEPALTADDDSHIFIAYTTNLTTIRVAVSSHPDFGERTYLLAREGGATKPLELVAETSPALIWGGGRLFLAWNYEGVTRVISSHDGVAFDLDSLVKIPTQAGYSPPALAYAGNKLYLVSIAEDRQMSLYISSDQGAHFQSPQALPMRSAAHPAFMWANPEGSTEPDFMLMWGDTPSDRTWGGIKVATAPRGDAHAFARTHEFVNEGAQGGIAAARFRGAWYFAWTGVHDQNHPNVARYTAGELVTYGLGGH